MRAFLAVELPEDIRRALAQLQRRLAESHADVKWTEEANLHITMRFLGEISQEQREAVEQLVARLAQRHHGQPVSLSQLGAFPSVSAPRVIWVGVGEGKLWLHQVASQVEDGLGDLGFAKEERAWTAHVTLGRVRSPTRRADLAARLRPTIWEPSHAFRVTHLTLFQSTLTGSGPIYSALARAPFGE